MKLETKNYMKKTVIFAIIGALSGYLASYFFQPKIMQKTISLVTYCTDIGEVLLKNKFGGMSKTVIVSIIVGAFLGIVIAYFTNKK